MTPPSLPVLCLALGAALSPAAGAHPLPPKAELGRQLFFDANLSEPAGQACADCHDPLRGFSDKDRGSPTSAGAVPGRAGPRNALTAMYADYSPAFHFDARAGLYYGGLFWDGRAASLEAQAKGPFLNPLEMANPDIATLIGKVRTATYAPLFARVFGPDALDDPATAYDHLAAAIAEFERGPKLNRFSSKYDAYLAGRVKLTRQEAKGLALFEAPEKGGCASCHLSRSGPDGAPPLFTDFSYQNIGVPKNPSNPFYALPPEFNPEGTAFVDLGLGGVLGQPTEYGKFKVPTLRNLRLTGPYMHNGYFRTLRGVVDFYNSRDRKPACPKPMLGESAALRRGCWPVPETSANLNTAQVGNLGLRDTEIDAILAFLLTLTDGYQP